MRTYVASTGAVFALLVVVHAWRLIEEGMSPAREPVWILITLTAAALSAWAGRLLWRSRRAG